MGQLADLPRSAVGAQFGAAGERLQALARGHDPRPIVAAPSPGASGGERGLRDRPLDGIGAVGLTLRRLAAELCDRLRERHLAPGRRIAGAALEDAPALRVAQPFPQPALEPDWIARLLLSRVEAAARARSCRPPELTAGNAGPKRGRTLAVSSTGEQSDEAAPEPRSSPSPSHSIG